MFVTTPGPTLAEERLRAGVTVTTLARAIGVSRPTVYEWERNPSLGELQTRRYLDALHRLVDQYPERRVG